jgi:hypothetical protein
MGRVACNQDMTLPPAVRNDSVEAIDRGAFDFRVLRPDPP